MDKDIDTETDLVPTTATESATPTRDQDLDESLYEPTPQVVLKGKWRKRVEARVGRAAERRRVKERGVGWIVARRVV